MSSSGRVEVEFEYTPSGGANDLAGGPPRGIAFGILLELVAHAVNAALPGFGIEDLCFWQPLRLDGPRRCRATVERASRRVELTSLMLGGTQARAVTHLSGRAVRLDERAWQDRLHSISRTEHSAIVLAPEERARELSSQGVGGGVLPDGGWPSALRRVSIYDDGALADLDLPLGSQDYGLHPLAADCGWLLAVSWAAQKGMSAAAIRPLRAEAFHVLESGARVDRIRIVHTTLDPSDGSASVTIRFERQGQLAAVISGLTITGAACTPAVALGDLRRRIELLIANTVNRQLRVENLIEAGASSLDLIRLQSAIHHDLGVEIDGRRLFEEPTLERLVLLCEQALRSRSAASVVDAAASAELSASQQMIWRATQSADLGAAYNECVALELDGEVELAPLNEAFAALLHEHPALRSRLEEQAGSPRVVPCSMRAFALNVLDMAANADGASAGELRARSLAYAREFVRQPFELYERPAFRACFLELCKGRGLLVLCAHHLFVDGWSLAEVLVPELARLYARQRLFCAGKHVQESSAVPYGVLAPQPTRVDAADIAWWKDTLDEVPARVSFLAAKPRPAMTSFAGAQREIVIPGDLVQRLDRCARNAAATRCSVLLSALAVVVQRASGQSRFCIGLPAANRVHSASYPVAGCFANMLPIPIRMEAVATWAQLVADVSRTLRGALGRQHVPLSTIVGKARAGAPGEIAFGQVVLALQPELRWDARQTGMNASVVHVDKGAAKTDLALVLGEQQGELRGYIEYRVDLWAPDEVERFAAALRRSLEALAAHASDPLAGFELLGDRDRAQLSAWNATARSYRAEGTLYDCFAEWAARAPTATAIVADGRATSYGELKSICDAAAAWLDGHGLRDAVVGVEMRRSVPAIVAVLAIWRMGGVYVPIDAAYPEARRELIRQRAGLAAVLTEAAPEVVSQASHPHGLAVELRLGTTSPVHSRDGNPSPAYVIFTSGSTGMPKGVVGHHRGLLNLFSAQAHAFGVTPTDVVLQFAPLGFDASLSELGMALTSGASLAIIDHETARSPARLAGFIRTHRVTTATLPPTLLAILDPELVALRCVVSAGEPCSEAIVRKWERHCQFYNAYGPTEASVCATLTLCNGIAGVPPIGHPIDNVTVHVLDDMLRALPVGWPGEICIGGVGVACGYLDDGRATERFVDAAPGKETGRLYRTGDYGRWRGDGLLEFLGRRDRQVKVRGHRVELSELEHLLLRHPGVAQCRACYVDRQPGGALHAYVQSAEPVDEAELKRFVARLGPSYLVPERISIVAALPLNEHGKVDDARLAASLPAVQSAGPAPGAAAEIVAAVLGLSALDLNRGFFDLGGDSISAVRVVELAREHGLTISIEDLYACGSLAELSALAEDQRRRQDEVDLAAEATLAPAPDVRAPTRASEHRARNVLVTGATGFLGAFVVNELLSRAQAQVVCLVRAPDPRTGRERMRDALMRYGLWQDRFYDRLSVIAGDLAGDRLGLSQQAFDGVADSVGAIIHCGALVDLAAPYTTLRAPNVRGTNEILGLAMGCGSLPVHFVSTLSVAMAASDPAQEVTSADPLPAWQNLVGGYARTKWVAERMVLNAGTKGLPVCVYRPGLIVADSMGGHGPSRDLFGRFVRTCLWLAEVPCDMELRYASPVDRVARVIVDQVIERSRPERVLHVADPRVLGSEVLLRALRRVREGARLTPYAEWRERVRASCGQAPLYPLLHLFPRDAPPRLTQPRVRCDMQQDERPIVDALGDGAPAWLDRFVETLAG